MTRTSTGARQMQQRRLKRALTGRQGSFGSLYDSQHVSAHHEAVTRPSSVKPSVKLDDRLSAGIAFTPASDSASHKSCITSDSRQASIFSRKARAGNKGTTRRARRSSIRSDVQTRFGCYVWQQDRFAMFLYLKFDTLGQAALKRLAEALINALCPKKRGTYSYKSGNSPEYWPKEVSTYDKGVHHIRKKELLPLMIVLTRLNWTQDVFIEYNGDKGDSAALEHGWPAFLERVMKWSDVEHLFIKKAAKGAARRQCFEDILTALREEHDYFDSKSNGNTWFETATDESYKKPDVLRDYPHYFERRFNGHAALRKPAKTIDRPIPQKEDARVTTTVESSLAPSSISGDSMGDSIVSSETLGRRRQVQRAKVESPCSLTQYDEDLYPPHNLFLDGGYGDASPADVVLASPLAPTWAIPPKVTMQGSQATSPAPQPDAMEYAWMGSAAGPLSLPAESVAPHMTVHPPMVLNDTYANGSEATTLPDPAMAMLGQAMPPLPISFDIGAASIQPGTMASSSVQKEFPRSSGLNQFSYGPAHDAMLFKRESAVETSCDPNLPYGTLDRYHPYSFYSSTDHSAARYQAWHPTYIGCGQPMFGQGMWTSLYNVPPYV